MKKSPSIECPNPRTIELHPHIKSKRKGVHEEQQVINIYIFFFFEKEQEGLSGQKEGLLSKGRGIA